MGGMGLLACMVLFFMGWVGSHVMVCWLVSWVNGLCVLDLLFAWLLGLGQVISRGVAFCTLCAMEVMRVLTGMSRIMGLDGAPMMMEAMSTTALVTGTTLAGLMGMTVHLAPGTRTVVTLSIMRKQLYEPIGQ